jgi:hypothetical protein
MRRLYRKAKAGRAPVTTLVWILGEIRKTMELTELTEQVERLKSMYLRYGAPELADATAGPVVPVATAKVEPEPENHPPLE